MRNWPIYEDEEAQTKKKPTIDLRRKRNRNLVVLCFAEAAFPNLISTHSFPFEFQHDKKLSVEVPWRRTLSRAAAAVILGKSKVNMGGGRWRNAVAGCAGGVGRENHVCCCCHVGIFASATFVGVGPPLSNAAQYVNLP
ncbi:unnamed protein product [Fraxinus pennsylvanica]|uniref:Uncharacterized protein n=1 Tax=Fraxinus pennsylvanica TaxID=56036 RepID=A0AAD1Z0I5_9LAMI|nr:unnamed protein product [Fraxinus pennsylvanica]